MQQGFGELAFDLLSSGYQKVVFLEIECTKHGAYRVGISPDQQLGERFACPQCHMLSPCSGIMACGYTRRQLPFSEFWDGRGYWDFAANES